MFEITMLYILAIGLFMLPIAFFICLFVEKRKSVIYGKKYADFISELDDFDRNNATWSEYYFDYIYAAEKKERAFRDRLPYSLPEEKVELENKIRKINKKIKQLENDSVIQTSDLRKQGLSVYKHYLELPKKVQDYYYMNRNMGIKDCQEIYRKSLDK